VVCSAADEASSVTEEGSGLKTGSGGDGGEEE